MYTTNNSKCCFGNEIKILKFVVEYLYSICLLIGKEYEENAKYPNLYLTMYTL